MENLLALLDRGCLSRQRFFSRKERKERKEMEGGNGESEANEVTLPLEPLRGCYVCGT